ncbi:MAG: trigger factor [Vicingaceae bacterium]
MNIERENIDKLNALVKIKLGPEDYEKRVEERLKDLRKKAKIPGFRQGHVPFGMIKKMAGTSTLVEEINSILSKSINEYISENKINILGNPLPKKDSESTINWEKQQEFEFEFELGLAPSFDPGTLDKVKVEKYEIQVNDKLMDQQTLDMAKRYGQVSESQLSVEDDMLTGTFEEVDRNGNLVDGGITSKGSMLISNIESKKLKKSLTGIGPGISVTIKYDQFNSDEEKAKLLGKKKEDLIFNKSPIKFTVEKVNHIAPAEVNQDLFDKIFGPGKVKSLEEFRQKMKDDLTLQFDQTSDQKLMLDFQEKLIEKSKIALPDKFLKRWLLNANDQSLTAEQIESEYDVYARSLKWQIIENHIIKEKNLEVTAQDAENYTVELLKKQFASYGQAPMEEEQMRETARSVLTNNEEAKRIFDQLYDQRLLEFLKGNLKIKEKKISYDDFLKLAKK